MGKASHILKTTCIIIAAFAVSLLNWMTAFADVPLYGRAVDTNAIIYKAPVEHKDFAMFVLPLSFYVTIISEEGMFYAVEYQDSSDGFTKIYGYIPKNALDTENQNPSMPLYLKDELSVLSDSYIYTRPDTTADAVSSCLKSQSVKYYGNLSNQKGEIFYFVKFGTVMGYIPSSNCSLLDYELNPDPLPQEELPPEEDGPKEDEPETQKPEVLQIILIISITVAALVIVYTAFRPRTGKPKSLTERYFDEEDE